MAGATITIRVDALTGEAAAKLQSFFNGVGAGAKSINAGSEATKKGAEALKQLREGSMLAKEGFHGLETTVLLLGGEEFPQLVRAVLAGRMALLTMRSAAQLTGLSLSTIAPITAGIGIAVAAGVSIWHMYRLEMEQAAEQARKTAEEIKGLGKFLEQVNALRAAGVISAAQQGFYLNVLRGQPASGGSLQDKAFLEWFEKNRKTTGRRAGEYFDPEALQQLQKYFTKQGSLVPNKEGTDYELNPAIEALQKIRELRIELSRVGDNDQEKKISEIADKYGKLAAAAKVWGAEAIRAGEYTQGSLDRLLKSLDQAEASELRALEFAKAQDDERKGHEAHTQRTKELEEQARTDREKLEHELTLIDVNEGQKRGHAYEDEFKKRKFLYDQQLYAGEISETDYTALVQEATIKRTEAKNQEAEENRRQAEAEAEIRLAQIQGKRHLIEIDPGKSELDKKEALLDLLRQENRLLQQNIEIKQQQVRDKNLTPEARLAAEKQLAEQQQALAANAAASQRTSMSGTFGGEFRLQAVEMKNQWGSLAKDLAGGAFATIRGGIDGMAGALTSLIMGTKSAAQAFGEFGIALLTGFIQMILQTVLYALVAIPILTALGVLSGGTTAATGAAVTTAAVSGAMGSVGGMVGRAKGGPLGSGQLSLVGEQGPELFVPDSAGTVIPAPMTASLMGASGSSGPVSHKTELTLAQFGGQAAAEQWARSQAGEVWFHDLMRRNIHRYRA